MRGVLRVGIMGCGRIAQLVHLPLLARMREYALVAVAERDERSLAAAKRIAPGAVAVGDYRQLADLDDVEAVVVCLPSGMHAEAASAAFERGKHVYLEKPLATDLRGARRVLDAQRESGRVGMIGFNYRFHPQYVRAAEMIRDGVIGTPTAARSVFCVHQQTPPAWKRDPEAGGGVAADLGSHHIDLCRYLLDREVIGVRGTYGRSRIERDTAALELSMTDGLVVQTFVAWLRYNVDRFEVHGTDGALFIDRLARRLQVEKPRRNGRLDRLGRAVGLLGGTPARIRGALTRPYEPSYEAAFRRFAESVLYHRPTGADLGEGYDCLRTILAADASAKERRIVSVAGTAE